jgi:hypothetical protein
MSINEKIMINNINKKKAGRPKKYLNEDERRIAMNKKKKDKLNELYKNDPNYRKKAIENSKKNYELKFLKKDDFEKEIRGRKKITLNNKTDKKQTDELLNEIKCGIVRLVKFNNDKNILSNDDVKFFINVHEKIKLLSN